MDCTKVQSSAACELQTTIARMPTIPTPIYPAVSLNPSWTGERRITAFYPS